MLVTLVSTGLLANVTEDARFASDELPTCTVTIKGDIGGRPINVTTTFEAENCAKAAGEMLKAALAKK